MRGMETFFIKRLSYFLISPIVISFFLFPNIIGADESLHSQKTFPIRMQSGGIITEEMLDAIKGVCDGSLPEKVDNSLFNVNTGGFYAKKGIFVPTKIKDPNILRAFNEVLKPGVRFLDLGSGDGRVVFLAALFGAVSTGIEFDKDIFETSIRAKDRLSERFDLSQAKLLRDDFFNADFSKFDVIYYFMGGSFEEGRLEEKLAREMSKGAVLVGYIEHKAFKKLSSAGRIGKRVTIYVKQHNSNGCGRADGPGRDPQ